MVGGREGVWVGGREGREGRKEREEGREERGEGTEHLQFRRKAMEGMVTLRLLYMNGWDVLWDVLVCLSGISLFHLLQTILSTSSCVDRRCCSVALHLMNVNVPVHLHCSDLSSSPL